MSKAGIIILNYNGWEDTIECINGLSCIKYPHMIIVVDNSSYDESYEQLQHRLGKEIVLIRNAKNLGYAGGNNVGLKYAVEHDCDFLCVLNNDTIIEEDFLTPCINELIEHSDTGFVGPTLIDYKTGLVQSTGGDISIKKAIATQKNRDAHYATLQERIECDYVGGACIVLKAEQLKRLGYIPESYFLFFEETEWCYKSKKRGYRNICLGKVCIKHKGSVSINKTDGLNGYLLNRNRIAFARRNCDKTSQALFIYVALVAKNIIRMIALRKDAIRNINAYYDGWNKKVDLKRFPFILIKE